MVTLIGPMTLIKFPYVTLIDPLIAWVTLIGLSHNFHVISYSCTRYLHQIAQVVNLKQSTYQALQE